MMSSIFSLFSIQVIEKWDLVVLDISIIGYFGVVFEWIFQTCKNYCTCVFLKEYLLYLSYLRGSTYDIILILSVVVTLSLIWRKLELRKSMLVFWWPLMSEGKLVNRLESSGSTAFSEWDTGLKRVLQKVPIVSLYFKNDSVLKNSW